MTTGRVCCTRQAPRPATVWVSTRASSTLLSSTPASTDGRPPLRSHRGGGGFHRVSCCRSRHPADSHTPRSSSSRRIGSAGSRSDCTNWAIAAAFCSCSWLQPQASGRRPPGLVSRPPSPVDPDRRRVSSSLLGRRGRFRDARAAKRFVLRDERCSTAVRSTCHGIVRLRAATRPRRCPPVWRLLLRPGHLPGGPNGCASGQNDGRDVLVYFNNDGMEGNAVRNAAELRGVLARDF